MQYLSVLQKMSFILLIFLIPTLVSRVSDSVVIQLISAKMKLMKVFIIKISYIAKAFFLVAILLEVGCSTRPLTNPSVSSAKNSVRSPSNNNTPFEELEICPISYVRRWFDHPNPAAVMDFETMMELKTKAENLEVGYTCKVPTSRSRTGYVDHRKCREYNQGVCHVRWTLVKKERGREIWAVHLGRAAYIFVGNRRDGYKLQSLSGKGENIIYVGDIEDGSYTFSEAKEVCENKEIVINGEKIKMTLPLASKILDDKNSTNINHHLNFALLKHLNYASVIYNYRRDHHRYLNNHRFLWADTLSRAQGYYPYVFWGHYTGGAVKADIPQTARSVLCIGL